jgi:hypothetical protein
MPFFDADPLARLAAQPEATDRTIDLRGIGNDEALARIERLLAEAADAERLLILFDAAADDGRETLFLPLGRRLLAARRDGRLQRCLPLQGGSGYFVQLAANER